MCGIPYLPISSFQKACSPKCAVEYAKQQKEKEKKKELRVRKEKIKSLTDLMNEAQTEFNKYIRYRDRHLPCVSCGRMHHGQYHAGHYKTRGAHPELRFSEFNTHKQCAPCNNHKSGDIVNFRETLKVKIGEHMLAWVEGPHQSQHWTKEEARGAKQWFKDKLKILKEQNDVD